jgi:hypothetical protein
MTPAAKKMLAWELLEHGTPLFLGRTRRRLGDVCAVTAGGSRVCSADATATQGSLANMLQACPMLAVPACPPGQYHPLGPAPCNTPSATCLPAGGRYPSFFQGGGIAAVGVPTVAQLLAQAQAVYNQNPANLTANQWALLQSAGIIPSTLPFTSASQLPGAQAAAVAAIPTTGSDIMLGSFDLTQFVGSVPWWGWALGAGGLLFLFHGQQKRGRR